MNVLTYLDSLDSDVREEDTSNRLLAFPLIVFHCRQIRLNSGQTLVHMLDRRCQRSCILHAGAITTSHNSWSSTYVIDLNIDAVLLVRWKLSAKARFTWDRSITSGCEFISVHAKDYLRWFVGPW